MALVAFVMVSLVATGYIGRGLVDGTVVDDAPTGQRSPTDLPFGASNAADDASTPLLPPAEEPVREVAQALGPSVVVIRNGDGLGSGVVYDRSGLILTNAHVVGSSRSVTVTLNDGRRLDGTVVGSDPATDIAVVRVDPDGELAAARFATDHPEVGDLVIALGSPFGLDQTITSGVVSAVNRPVANGVGGVVNMVQTDAAINPGNSGGALANRRAEVVGINSMIFSQSGTNTGIGFAVPVAKARSVAERLVTGGPVDRAYLGVRSSPTSDGGPGAQLVSVEPDSAAAVAGLVAGDVVLAMDGLAVKDPTDLAGAVAAHEPGDEVSLMVRRGDNHIELTTSLGAADAGDAEAGTRGRTPINPNRPG